MDKAERVVYEFGGFRLDPVLRILLRNGEPVTVWPKVFDTLLLLLQSNGRIVEKEELMRVLWPESFVEESNLTQNIFVLRKILGDDRNGHSFIQTVPRRGYKFIAPVREAELSSYGSDLPAHYWSSRSPFRGLQIFETEDAWLFFGRELETDELLAHLRRSPVLAVVGNSGSGKSSLIRAGLIPALQQERFAPNGSANQQWRIAVFRPSVAPFDYLAEVLPTQLAPELRLQEGAGFIRDFRNKLSAGEDSLRDAIAALAGAISHEAGPSRILLVADQFEEIFTLTTSRQQRDRYIDALLAAAQFDSAVPVHLVLAVRADFYADCMEHAALSRAMAANQYNVGRMSHDQLRESIEKRLQLASAQAEAGLIDSLLEDVGSEPGNLALLEHALGQLWEKCGGFACTLTNNAYTEIGRLRGALGRHADDVYAGLRDDAQKQLAKKIFLELVHLGDGAQDTRRRVPKADLLSLGQAEEVEALLAHLASSRLISTGGEEQESFVEVSHEALIREWPLLREWLTQNREDLRLERRLLQAAEEWESLNRDRGALLQGARLAQAEEWLGRHAEVSVLLQDFVQASVAAREEAYERELAEQKAAAARLRWFSCGLALLLLLAIGASGYIYHERVLEKSRAMAAQSGELLQRDHGQALDLAIRSWETARTEEARLALGRALPEALAVLKHDAPVITAKFSPDGQHIVSASFDHTARVWDTVDGHLLFTLNGHADKVEYAAFSPDGQQIVTTSDDHTARIWRSADGQLLFTLRGHSDVVWQAHYSADSRRLVTASSDNTARVWDARNGHLLKSLLGHTNTVGEAVFSPDGKRIITTSWDDTARIWNSANGRLLTTLQHTSNVIDAAFSPDNRTITTVTAGGTAHVWNSDGGRRLFTLEHDGWLRSLAYSPDSRRLVTANLGRSGAKVWDIKEGRLLFSLSQGGPTMEVAFSVDGSRILTAGVDHTARLWSSADGNLLAMLERHSAPIKDVAFSPDGQRILTASDDQTALIWSTISARLLATLQSGAGLTESAFFSPNGERIVTVSLDKSAMVWNSADGRLLATLQGHTAMVYSATFSPDGQSILTASDDHTARIWNAADGRLLNVLQGHTDAVRNASYSTDGRRVATSSNDRTARIWNASTGKLVATLRGHTDTVSSARFSPDGQRVITASNDHTARLWSATDGRLLAILHGHSAAVRTAVFSPDGQWIATASPDSTARIWNADDGSLLAVLRGHTDKVNMALFSPDGKRVLTASFDNTARIWNAADGRLLSTLRGHTDTISMALFSPDGKRIITASFDNTARVWNTADGELIAVLKGNGFALTTGQFSPDGQRIVTASQTPRIWQIVTLDDITRILAH